MPGKELSQLGANLDFYAVALPLTSKTELEQRKTLLGAIRTRPNRLLDSSFSMLVLLVATTFHQLLVYICIYIYISLFIIN